MRSMASMETEQEVKLSRGEVQGSDNAAFSHYTLLLLIFATEFTGVVTPLIIRKSLQLLIVDPLHLAKYSMPIIYRIIHPN